MTSDVPSPGPAGQPPFDPATLSLLWATHQHAGAIAGLHGAMFPDAWDEASLTTLLSHPGSVALVASQRGSQNIGGFALAQVAADEAEILTLGVVEPWRGQGVGLRLVEGLQRAAGRAGAKSLFLEVAEGNAAALRLYAKAGFLEAGRRAGYYQRAGAPAEDAIVLRSTLGGAPAN